MVRYHDGYQYTVTTNNHNQFNTPQDAHPVPVRYLPVPMMTPLHQGCARNGLGVALYVGEAVLFFVVFLEFLPISR